MIEDCSKLGVHTIEITGGGEPMMRRDLMKILEKIKSKKIYGRLISNGTLFDEKKIKRLIKIGWDEIVFSLDAPEKEVNDYLRGESFEKVVTTIKKLQLEKMKTKREKPYLNIHMVLCNKNFKLLPKMFEFAYELNCRNLLVEPIVLLATKTKAGKELLFREKDRKALIKSIRKASEIAREHNFQTNVDKLEFELIESTGKMKKIIEKEGKGSLWSSLPCYQPFYRMIVRPWGVVGPCCMFDNIGENVKNKSLKEIWYGEYFEKIRKSIMERKFSKYCSICNAGQVFENRRIRRELSWMRK
jgi:MoaA/NifB/PqqE/SkfB family radical SAM enzyme